MVRELDLIGRLGNKTNDIKYFIDYLPLDKINIIEPFGGSFSVIRKVYYEDKYLKFVNDLDSSLYEVYIRPYDYAEFRCRINEIALDVLNDKGNVVYNDFKERIDVNHPFYKFWMESNIIKGNLVKTLKNLTIDRYEKQIQFMDKIRFSNVDYYEYLKLWSVNENSFIFLDPPYLFSDNSTYQPQDNNNDSTDIIVKINEILRSPETKAKIMLIINDLKILRFIFDGFIKGEYLKIYQLGKKKMKHLVITNY